jgi:hypothetical protein
MSTVFQSRGIKFKINSNDHNPPHVHVEGYGCNVRVNLLTLEQMDDTEFSHGDLKRIIDAIQTYQDELMAKWEEYHGKD